MDISMQIPPAFSAQRQVELCDGRLKELKATSPGLQQEWATPKSQASQKLSAGSIKTGSGPLMDRSIVSMQQHGMPDCAIWWGSCTPLWQAAIAKIFDLRPGAEFFAAIEVAEQRNLPLVCGDRDVDETMQDLKEAFLKDWWSLLTSSSQVPGTKGRERLTVAASLVAALRDREMIARLREELKLSMQRYAESSKSGVAQGSALQRCTSL
ncbi:unnamed protein product [Symbiodinium necroappetens]|uniref:Uncharacterized protein n=1 Tax=Symbiodinium necroappetens TaxID=1628268 RepID=A0A812UJP8_9DINO|nr:unnamed protein product [Symbiodinium necroappetens]